MPYLFNGKELDTETGLYYYGARYYDPKVSIFLNVDPLVEETRTSYTYTNNNPIMLIDPTGMKGEDCPTCPDEIYLALSEHIYTPNLKEGMKAKNGWTVKKVDETESGHVGAVYEGVFNGKTEYIYSNKGTTMSSLMDWDNNISQAETGGSRQYYDAIKLAEKYSKIYKGMSYTGHSKGGGQGKSQAMAVGGKAVVFNPAAVSDKTIENYKLDPSSANIKSIIVGGEILDLLQTRIGTMRHHGEVIKIAPAYMSSATERHGIDMVKKSYEVYQGKRKYTPRPN